MRAPSWLCVMTLFAAFNMTVASDPPDSEKNPVTGAIESVDSIWDGSTWQIRHTTDAGKGSPITTTLLTDDPEADNGPRLAINPAGNCGVAWWREDAPHQVLYMHRQVSETTWSEPQAIGLATEVSREPEIVATEDRFWIAFEIEVSGGGKGIAVNGIMDSPEPIPERQVLTTTSYEGDVDVQVNGDQGVLWTTWIDSASDVGWSEYDDVSATWSTPAYESYANDTPTEARDRIRALLTE